MTDRYGSLAGALTQKTPPQFIPATLSGEFEKRLVFDTVLLAAAPIADRIWAGKFSVDTVPSPGGLFYYDALGASTTLSLGDITYPAGLAAAASTSSAGSRAMVASVAISLYGSPLWKQLGYATRAAAITANGGATNIDLWFTIGGAAATGNVTWKMDGCDG